MRRRWRLLRDDRGAATAELAAAMPAFVLLLLAGLAGSVAVSAKQRCVDAARDAALAQARGGDGVAAGRGAAPDGASIAIDAGSDTVRATVSVTVRPFGGHLPGFAVAGRATAAVEPGAP